MKISRDYSNVDKKHGEFQVLKKYKQTMSTMLWLAIEKLNWVFSQFFYLILIIGIARAIRWLNWYYLAWCSFQTLNIKSAVKLYLTYTCSSHSLSSHSTSFLLVFKPNVSYLRSCFMLRHVLRPLNVLVSTQVFICLSCPFSISFRAARFEVVNLSYLLFSRKPGMTK